MAEIQIISNKNDNNNICKDKLSYSHNLILDLLQSYSYEEIMNYIFDKDNKIDNDNLKLKLKELVEKIDIEELAKLLTKDEINKLFSIKKNEEQNNLAIPNENENKFINLENNSKKVNSYNKNKTKKAKSKEKSKPYINKVIYRKDSVNDIIYIYRFISFKKGNIYLLRCQDKSCRSKAFYNLESKELCIYEDHSIDINKHIYLSDKSNNFIKELILYMKNNKEISSLEIFSDNSKNIINNIKENHCLKKLKEAEKDINNNIMLNKKRNNSSIIFKITKLTENKVHPKFKFKANKNDFPNRKKGVLFVIKNEMKNKINNEIKNINNDEIIDKSMSLNSNEKISLNEDEKEEEFVNDRENYCEIKDKYLKHKQLLTKYEQICFGENRRLGTHFHKENDDKIYNYFGNNKEIKDFNMNYRCTLKGCKSKAIYDMKSRIFKILKEHTKPYEEHYCSNPKDKKTKEWINYLNKNDNLSDLQIILI